MELLQWFVFFSNYTRGPSSSMNLSSLRKSVFSQERRTNKIKKEKHIESTVVLNAKDEQLINRGEFIGSRSVSKMVYKTIPLENAVSLIQEQVHRNQRVNAELFMVHLVLPLENRNLKYKEALLRKADFYVPLIFRFCGRMMTDLNKQKRIQLLKRCKLALEKNSIPFSLASINAWLESRLDNDDTFDVNDVLKTVEESMRLVPDLRFFNCLAWQYAKLGNFREYDNLVYEMKKRGLTPDFNTALAQIYCAERSGVPLKSESLIKRYIGLYGKNRESEALGAACRGAVAGEFIDRLRVLLRKAVVKDNFNGRNVLVLSSEELFDVIFLLAEMSVDEMGKLWMSLVQEVLEHANRKAGYFKKLYSEAERHINHNYFYTTIAILMDMSRIRDSLETQSKGIFTHHLLGRFANRMVSQRLDKDVMLELANRLATIFGSNFRFYDNIVYAILTYRYTSSMEKFEQFKLFTDMIDPERERIHLILPLIASCTDPFNKCKMLYRCANIGYTKVSEINALVMTNQVIVPLIEVFERRYPTLTDVKRLKLVAELLESYGISSQDTWLMFRNMLTESKKWNINIMVSHLNLMTWLNEQKNTCFPKADPLAEERLRFMDYSSLRDLVLKLRNPKEVHDFLLKRGFPPETNFEEITEPLLYLYIETANWGYIQKLLQLLSQHNSKTSLASDGNGDSNFINQDDPHHHIKNYHFLRVLRRNLDELPSDPDLSSVVNYVYELKRLFPTTVADSSTFFETIGEYRRLFNALLSTPVEFSEPRATKILSTQRVKQSIELLSVLVRLNIINLHANESRTAFIVWQVLRGLGWNEAVEVWMNFQSAFYCSNGMIELLRHAIRIGDTHKIYFVMHKARSVTSSGKGNAFLAAAYLLQHRKQDAENTFANMNQPMSAWDVVSVFRLTNAWLTGRTNYSNFPYAFMELCLKYTNLPTDEKALTLCHADWVRHCDRRNLGDMAIQFLDLFDKYKIKIDDVSLKTLNNLLIRHSKMLDKWIMSKTRLLNTDCLGNTEVLKSIRQTQLKQEQIVDRLA